MAKLFIIRHAQASFGSENYDSLSDLGKEQAAMLGHYFKNNNIVPTRIYTGTLHRQQQKARIALEQIFGKNQNIIELKITPQLDEFTPVFWEAAARNLAEINPSFNATIEKLIVARKNKNKMSKGLFYKATINILKNWQSGLITNTNIEPYQDFKDRIIGFYKSKTIEIPSSETIFAVSSGTPISILLARLQPQRAKHDFEWLARICNTSWQSIAIDDTGKNKKPVLTSVNNLTHLNGYKYITLI